MFHIRGKKDTRVGSRKANIAVRPVVVGHLEITDATLEAKLSEKSRLGTFKLVATE